MKSPGRSWLCLAMWALGCGGGNTADAGMDTGGVDCTTAAEGTPCGDAMICANDACGASTCGDAIVDARTEQCDDGNTTAFDGCTSCQEDCVDDSDCDDEDACTGMETCTSRVCQTGTPLSEGATCMTAGGASGVCMGSGLAIRCVGSGCGNGVVEAGEDCDDMANGDDADGCTDACAFTCEVDADCLDADLCDGSEVCNTTAHTCGEGTALNCDDSVPCTMDGCVPATGCTHTPDNAMCNDSVPCTDDSCSLTGCVFAPNNSRCSDGVDCTVDVCTATGCQANPDNGRCNDGVGCTNDVCTSSGCQFNPDSSRCNDGIACTDDSCTTGGCQFAPQNSRCPASNCQGQVCNTSSGCTSTGSLPNCRVINGRQIFAVSSDAGQSGTGVCAAANLRCQGLSAGTLAPNAACSTFHPGTFVFTDPTSGFGGGIYCNGETAGVCAGAGTLCHECTGCIGAGCGTGDPSQLTEFYVECLP